MPKSTKSMDFSLSKKIILGIATASMALPVGAVETAPGSVKTSSEKTTTTAPSSIKTSPGSTTTTENVFCLRNLKSTVTRVSKTPLPAGYSDLKDYQITADFRSDSKDIPWSEAVAINDPVTGESVGVLDRNYVPGGSRVNSQWTRGTIQVNGYWLYSKAVGGFGGTIVATFYPFEADILWIPDKDSFLIVKGCNGSFTVTQEVADALLNQEPGKNAWIRFSTENTGGSHLSQIGKGTVEAWKKIYANWSQPAPSTVEAIGF